MSESGPPVSICIFKRIILLTYMPYCLYAQGALYPLKKMNIAISNACPHRPRLLATARYE